VRSNFSFAISVPLICGADALARVSATQDSPPR